MFLTASNTAHYLLDRGQLDARTLVRGDLQIVESHRRNRNFKLIARRGTSLFIKQVRSFGEDAVSTVRREAALLRRVAEDPRLEALQRVAPRFVDFDDRHCALVLELVSGVSVHEHMSSDGRHAAAIGAALGAGLGACHRSEAVRGLGLVFANMVMPPWPLRLGDGRLDSLPRPSPVQLQFIAAVRRVPALVDALARVRASWRPDGLVHADVKLDNMVWSDDERLVLTDWELVDHGDIDWDTGSALQAFLVPWLAAVPWQQGHNLVESLQLAPISIEATHRACRAFWSAYLDTRAVPESERAALRDRCVRHAAVRLLQTAFEFLQHSRGLSPMAQALIPCSLHMLCDPRRAGADLLGLTDTKS